MVTNKGTRLGKGVILGIFGLNFFEILSISVILIRLKVKLLHGNKAKLECPSLALLRYKSNFLIFELALIAVQIEFSNFRAWPYCEASLSF